MRAGLFLEGLSRAFRVQVHVVPVFELPPPDPLEEARLALSTPAGRARMEATHPLPELAARAGVREAAAFRGGRFDAVHVLRLYLAPFAERILESLDGARPFTSIDVDDDDAAVCMQLGLTDEAARFERLARYSLPRFDLVVTASADEPGRLAIPNAVAPPARVDAPARDAPWPTLLLVGDLGYRPNADAALRLCDEILPALRAVAPEARALVVGNRPPAAVQALAERPGVVVTGRVESVAPWYAEADVAVVPLAAGSGCRTKIVEAFAHRVPVVSTAAGAAGLGLGDGVLLEAESADEFVAAVLRLHRDAALRRAIVDAAEDAFRRRFSIDVVAETIASTWAATVGAHERP
jgi:glycosyltransferase involved in cell wall biosynthesis